MTTLAQRSFSSGEISPSLYARVDLTKYATGLRTAKNGIILRYGGFSNRAGTEFVCETGLNGKTIRKIPFIFNASQTYVLEFGEGYMRVIKAGVLQTLTAQNITSITSADPAVVTIAGHGYSSGDEVALASIGGMTELNGRNFKITVLNADTFSLQYLEGGDVDSTAFTAYTSGGTAAKVYEITTPFQESELSTLYYVQSADVISLAHPNYPPYDLSRTGDTTWSLDQVDFSPNTTQPTSVSASAGGAGSNTFRYKVTAVNAETGEESLPGTGTASMTITAITSADPAVVTSTAHGLSDGEEVYISGVVGMTELNGRIFYVANVTANTFELENEDSTNYTTYASGGTALRAFVKLTSAATPSTSAPNVISWTKVAEAVEYNVFKETNGVYGQIGIATGTSFSDINITANTSYTPPSSRNPFIGAGNYPSTVTYIQQRRAYAAPDSNPEDIHLSRTGDFTNFTKSQPLQDDDAITFNMAGRQVNKVKHMVDLGRLVVLTSGGEWSVAGNEAGVITPTSINTKQYSYNGSGDLSPIIIDGAAIYQQARGSIIRDLGYDFTVDGYTGNDLTIFNAHLFDKYTLVDWAYQQIPHSILWAVRSDGVLLGMTFVRNQNVMAWHRHDLGGSVENVCVVPEGNEDVLYVTVKRTINGVERRYIEKMTSRQIVDIVDMTLLDSHLSYDGRNTAATTMTLSGGTDWIYTETLTLTASASFFTSADVGNAIHLESATGEVIRCSIVGYTSATVVSVRPHKTVPANLRSTARTTWSKAVDQVTGLWHLEGEDVSVFADGFVVASPNNASYSVITVADGTITLDKPYSVIHVGLPYITDFETLDVDTSTGETISDKSKLVNKVSLYVEESRGMWAGSTPPSDDDTDPLEGLTEFKLRSDEGYDDPAALLTEVVDVNIEAGWTSNGRIFVRQVDPVPMTILSAVPAGKIPFR